MYRDVKMWDKINFINPSSGKFTFYCSNSGKYVHQRVVICTDFCSEALNLKLNTSIWHQKPIILLSAKKKKRYCVSCSSILWLYNCEDKIIMQKCQLFINITWSAAQLFTAHETPLNLHSHKNKSQSAANCSKIEKLSCFEKLQHFLYWFDDLNNDWIVQSEITVFWSRAACLLAGCGVYV